MIKTDWKIGDKFECIVPKFRQIGYTDTYVVTGLSTNGVYFQNHNKNEAFLNFSEMKEVEDQPIIQDPVEKILIVNKSMPEFSVYVEKTEDAIKKFFFGTRLTEFYVIDSGKLIELKTSNDIKKLFQVNDHFDKILTMEVGNTIMIDNHEFTLHGDSNEFYLYDKTYSTIHGEYIRKTGHTKAWYTLQEFSDMLKNKTYYIGK